MHNPKFESRVRKVFPAQADSILAIIRGNRAHTLTYASAAHRDRESYHPHDTYMLKLEALNEVLDTCGVEYVEAGRGRRSPAFEYLNMGDTYDTTVLYFPVRRVWRIGSWGDQVEQGRYS